MSMRVALLRGVNVGGHRRVPMAELRAAIAAAGFTDVATYVASGNLLFADAGTGAGPASEVEERLERLIADRFAVDTTVIVRDAAAIAALVLANPFPAAADDRAKLLHVVLAKRVPAADAATTLAAKAGPGEAIARAGDALWIDFAEGAARSKLTPALIDRAIGSPATARNWTTLTKLAALTRA